MREPPSQDHGVFCSICNGRVLNSMSSEPETQGWRNRLSHVANQIAKMTKYRSVFNQKHVDEIRPPENVEVGKKEVYIVS